MAKRWPCGEDIDVLIREHAQAEREDHGGVMLTGVLAALFVSFVTVILLWALGVLHL
jgi:uncharacterized membrane protein